MKSNNKIAAATLDNMSVEDLRAIAKEAGVKVGKSKKNTVENLSAAVTAGSLHCKSLVTFSVNPAQPGDPSQRKNLFIGEFRTYTSGPGSENEVRFTCATPADTAPAATDEPAS